MASETASAGPRVLHVAPGRVRVHWPRVCSEHGPDVGQLLAWIAGATTVRASTLTRNVLVQFDERVTTADEVLGDIRRIAAAPAQPAETLEQRGRGEGRPATTSLAPPAPGTPVERKLPDEPVALDFIERAARTAGAIAGLCLLAARRQAGPLPGSGIAAAAASAVILFQGSSTPRAASGRLLGHRGRSALLGAVVVAACTVSGSPLGLAIEAVLSSRQLLEAVERRRAFRAYRRRSSVQSLTESGCWTRRLDDGDRLPVAGSILEGVGFAVDEDALAGPVGPGSQLTAGSRLFGGPFVVELNESPTHHSKRRSAPVDDSFAPWHEVVALTAAAITFLATRSISRTVGTLLLLSARAEIMGREAADAGANRRALRSGALPLREGLTVRRPDLVLIDRARLVSEGLEVSGVDLQEPLLPPTEAIDLALSVASLAGSPWGPIWPVGRLLKEGEGSFDGHTARAEIDGRRFTLALDGADGGHLDGDLQLVLSAEDEPLAVVRLRPRLTADAAELAAACRRHGVVLLLAHEGGATSARRSLARKMGLTLARGSPGELVRRASAGGRRIALVTDAGDDGDAAAHADLAIGLATELSEPFTPAVDMLVPDLATAAAVLDAGARRDLAVHEARQLSATANVLGAAWIVVGAPGHRRAGTLSNLATIAALLSAWLRLRGGSPPRSTAIRLVDPRPEKWGRRAVADVLSALATSERGLSGKMAATRPRGQATTSSSRNAFAAAALAQVRSPLTGFLAAGAGLSLATSAFADVVLISAVIALNALVGGLQERQAGKAAEALERMGQVTANVLRDGHRARIPASEFVPGDVLLLAPGDHVAADARVLLSQSLQIDEASLTGESFPVAKRVEGGSPEDRIVLDGTDVTVGSGRAAVFAVGRDTRLGTTAAALAGAPEEASPLGRRLNKMLVEVLPAVLGGGVLVILGGFLWRRPLAAQLALGASTAIAAVPEGLPLLASLGEAAAARRLAARNALVRRLSAVESLGRADVVCVDKTGTITENRLQLAVVVGPTGVRAKPRSLTAQLRHILRCAALASPRPGSAAATAHATDVAVVEAARAASLADGLDDPRDQEIPFDASRPFHGALVHARACLKGSAEELAPRCTRIRRGNRAEKLGSRGRAELLDLAHQLADEGLRVLMVAEGSAETRLADPGDLVALGFLGFRDTVRPAAAEAVRRCREAGIRLIMLTGDHPATARAIGQDIGLLDGGGVLTGAEIDDHSLEELATALEGTSVVARIVPLEKLRIIEALRRRGHVVAMTGDGVNDAPALRLADAGIAMGPSGTEVARQAADLVLIDDDLTVLAEALIEGRTFWGNLRVALAMLLGGNLGEVAFMVTLACAGFVAPLTPRQVLMVNLISDVLPATSLVVQPPRRRDLSRLALEGEATLGAQLRREIVVRAVATAIPSLAAYLVARVLLGPPGAQSVGFGAINLTQLTQTLDASREAGRMNLGTTAAVAGSTALLAASLHLRPLQSFLLLTTPGVPGWILIAAASVAAPAVSRALGRNEPQDRFVALPAPGQPLSL